jgi:SAM-dependent methyltransferase
MGRSDPHVLTFYNKTIKPKGSIALLGFSNNNFYNGDLYDLSLDNWNINSEWMLKKKYDTIICTRCAYFAEDPWDFIERCHEHLNKDGVLYVDWGLGDHWRFEDYKIGWVKNERQEYAYQDDNYLWSTVWDKRFKSNDQYKFFCKNVEKFGYNNVEKAIIKEVPRVLKLDYIKLFFNVEYDILSLWEDSPQLYVLIKAIKK